MRKIILCPSLIGCFAFCLGVVGVGLQSLADHPISFSSCSSAEQCYKSALHAEAQGLTSPDELLRLFHRVQLQYPGTSWGRKAGVRMGLMLREEEPVMAQQYFRSGLQDYPLLEDYFRMWIGETWRHMGEVRRAAQEYQSILALEQSTPVKIEAAVQGGHAWFEVGECRQAMTLLDQALEWSMDFSSAPQAWLELAQCGLTQGQPARVQEALRLIWIHAPEFYRASEVQQMLAGAHAQGIEWVPSMNDRFARAKTFMKTAQFQQAVDALQEVLSGQSLDTSHREKFLYALAMAYVRLKEYPKAEQVFYRLSRGTTSYAGKATVWLARVYLRQDKGKALLALGKTKTRTGLSKSQKASVMWMGGLWLEDQKRYAEALKVYHSAESLAGSSRVGLDAYWRSGWLHYQLREYRQASESFQKLAKRAKNGRKARQATYWMARSLAHLGRTTKANRLYRQLAEDFPLTYYGQLARLRVDLPSSEGRSTRPITPSLEMTEDRVPRFHQETAYRRAIDLMGLGLKEEATRELLTLQKDYGSNSDTLVDLARLLIKNDAYHEAIRMASRFTQQERFSQEPSLKVLAYPVGYFPTIQEFASSQVNPYLVSGIIREESLYNAQALSRVGAMGLMQLMPNTAKRVAGKLGLSWDGQHELFRPERNIQLGTMYLGQLLNQFEGNIIHAVAAYNAGPKPVMRWIARFGQLAQDEFVELISYKETRGYVKRVLTSYHVYRDMVPTICSMKSLDSIC